MPAKVYLIGAGPGDPGLITVRGASFLAQADVVVYDYLSNISLLDLARPDARCIFVGKKGFSPHITQDQINHLLVEVALGGAATPAESDVVVARLKGGDPFVFGRGGEEALALSEAGIDFEVVPGVTAGIAAPATAGIPVTHRGISSSVAFITGNEGHGKVETDIDWQGIAHGAQTLCFYMGVHNLGLITGHLIDSGLERTTPVALVRWGTTPRQEVLTGTLDDITGRAEAAGFEAPAIICVGNVVSLCNTLGHDERPPLAGRVFAITRTRTQASALSTRLRELGADVIECPTIRIEPLDDYSAADEAIHRLTAGCCGNGGYDWLVLTSTNGVDHFFRRLAAAGLDSRSLCTTKVAAIGSATAKELSRHGIAADLVPDEYKAEAAASALLQSGVGDGTRVLIARAEHARTTLPDLLGEAGAEVCVVPLYRTLPETGQRTAMALDLILEGKVDSVTFTSSSTVRNFIGLVEARRGPGSAEEVRGGLRCYSIGPVTTRTLLSCGGHVDAQAEDYDIDGLVKAIVEDAAGGCPS